MSLSQYEAGEWYLVITCKYCKTRQPLLHDLSRGQSRIKATYKWSCASCRQVAEYDSDTMERYQHPKPTHRPLSESSSL